MLVVEDDEFVNFHAKQSIAYSVVVIAAYFVVGMISLVFGLIPTFIGDLLGLMTWFLYPVVSLASFAGWVWLLYQAYEGNWFRLPIIGNIVAEN